MADVVVVDIFNVTIDGVPTGSVVDTIANYLEHAGDIQDALFAYVDAKDRRIMELEEG